MDSDHCTALATQTPRLPYEMMVDRSLSDGFHCPASFIPNLSI